MASIADEVQALEGELARVKADLENHEARIITFDQQRLAAEAKSRQLQAQVDEHERNPFKEQVADLKAKLRENKASKQVAKLKARLRAQEQIVAREQALRMKAEDKPEIAKENDELNIELAGITGLMSRAGVTLKDMREAVIANAKLDLAAKREQART